LQTSTFPCRLLSRTGNSYSRCGNVNFELAPLRICSSSTLSINFHRIENLPRARSHRHTQADMPALNNFRAGAKSTLSQSALSVGCANKRTREIVRQETDEGFILIHGSPSKRAPRQYPWTHPLSSFMPVLSHVTEHTSLVLLHSFCYPDHL